MTENSYLYMHYYEDTIDKGYVFAWFYKNCHEKAFYLYVRSDLNVKKIIPERLWDYVYEVSPAEENDLVDDMTLKGKQGYGKKLIELGFEQGYKLYKMYSTPTFMEELLNKRTNIMDNSFRDLENKNKPVFYIVLRNDLNFSAGQQAVYIAQMTAAITEDIRFKFNYNNITYLNFVDLKDNIVVLQASGKELFEDNYIPIEYDNENIVFNYLTDEENKVAHNNFRLGESKVVALGYYGIKKDLPKYLRKLDLYKGE